MRRLEIAPLIVALGALVLLVSLFLEWYGNLTAWEAFEVADVLMAALAIAALVTAVGLIAPEVAYVDRRWLLPIVLGLALLVIAEILSPPPSAGDEYPETGAWMAFAAAFVMLAGTVLSVGRVSLQVAYEAREARQRVAAVDHRPPPTETGQVVARPAPREDDPHTGATEALPGETAGGATTGEPGRGGGKT
jgi:hypothetical protein